MIDFARYPIWFAVLALLFIFSMGHASECNHSIPPTNPDNAYIVHGDGTVTDIRTGLMWKQCEEGFSGSDCATGSHDDYNWADALAAAEASSFAGYTDWRLPNLRELHSLIELCRNVPAINTTIFPNVMSPFVWTSSPSAWSPDSANIVDFSYGYDYIAYQVQARQVRFVRGGL